MGGGSRRRSRRLLVAAACFLLQLLSRPAAAGDAPALGHSIGPAAASDDTSAPQPSQARQRGPGAHLPRCRGTLGRWCALFQRQQPVPAKLAPAHSKACPNGCSGVGVCNAMTGQCDCPAGAAGPDCSQEQKRPCSDGSLKYRGPGTQPASHIGPDKRDIDWAAGGWSASRCGGVCDDDKGLCYCDGPEFGRIPPPPGSPPGTPAVRVGRPLSEYCQPSETEDGRKAWGRVSYAELYGAHLGWCNVAVGVQPAVSCACPDGLAGTWCEQVTEQVCPNSCSGHGRCDAGFCHCDAGWFGHDCAGRVQGQPPDAFDQSQALAARPWLAGHLVPPVAAAEPAPGATRLRPLIYVYDTPAWAATRMLQYRGTKAACTWRQFEEGNATALNGQWVYSSEMLIHEMLLASPHRTMDPEEADLFYVPAYTACYAWPVQGWADYPWWYSAGGPRVAHMAKMLLELKRHIQQAYPYWNHTQGADHIWLAPHDEGACWLPSELYQRSIVLTHWGRQGLNHTSNTAFPFDSYNYEWTDPAGREGNVSWTHLIKGHACYTPGKDLVIPSPKFPAHYRWSPLLGAPPQARDTLLYFRGDVGAARTPNYSRGIRQRLHALAKTPEWVRDFNVKIGSREELPGDYSQALASSRFCLVAPGDGWSARAEDAVLHGCVPVIVQDGVHAPLESLLHYPAFAIRVPEAQVDRLPHVLQAVSDAELARLQRNLRRVWHRFAYLSQPLLRRHANDTMAEWARKRHQQQAADGPQQPAQGSGSSPAAGDTGPAAGAPGHLHQQQRRLAEQQQQQRDVGASGGALNTLLASMQALRPAAPWRHSRARRAAGPEDGDPAPFQLTEEHVQDDAFGTLMQWLHARSLQVRRRHRQRPRRARRQQRAAQAAAPAAPVT